MAEARDRRPGLRILAFVHGYPPLYNAGAEYMLASMFRWHVEHGHQCRVMLPPGYEPYTRHGVQVVSAPAGLEGAAFYKWSEQHAMWSNMILTHLDFTVEAVGIGRVNQRPVIHLVHNQSQLGYFQVTRSPLVIFNSEWVAAEVAWTGGPSVIVRPPVFARDYRVEPNGARPSRSSPPSRSRASSGSTRSRARCRSGPSLGSRATTTTTSRRRRTSPT